MVLESPTGCTTHCALVTAKTDINTITLILGRARASLRGQMGGEKAAPKSWRCKASVAISPKEFQGTFWKMPLKMSHRAQKTQGTPAVLCLF